MKTLALAAALAVTAPVALAAPNAPRANLVETAAATERFDRLLAAADAAGLTATLAGDGPYTVFAPVDAAFDTIPYEIYRSLLQPANRDTLAQVLSYHVIPGHYTANDLAGRQSFLTTAQGQRLLVDGVSSGTLLVNEIDTTNYNVREMAKAIPVSGSGTDISAANGVLIPIDRVLLPQ
jgi:uncharacterized surface protein with fasciclin (FAS1) repeats